MLSGSTCTSYIITESTTTTDCDTHSANLAFHLNVDEGLDVWSTGEHLDGCRRAVNLLRRSGTADEEHDTEDITSLIHSEDGSHPRADPLEMLWGLNDPNEDNFAGRDSSIGIASDKITYVRDLMSYTNTSGEKHDCSVGMHHVHTSIWSLGVTLGD